MSKPTEQMSWGQIGVIWLVALPVLLLFISYAANKRAARRQNKPPAASKVAEQDPVAMAAFQSGYEFAAQWKATGLAKPTEQELDGHALRILNEVRVPDDKRGLFITKFKRGFAWGD